MTGPTTVSTREEIPDTFSAWLAAITVLAGGSGDEGERKKAGGARVPPYIKGNTSAVSEEGVESSFALHGSGVAFF